ncbi:MAG: RNA polymerase sigma factor [Thermodesulfobacteriota bacterium]
MKPLNRQSGSALASEEEPGEPLDERDLIALAVKEDPAAMEELIRRFHQKAFAIAYRHCSGDVEEARDLTQEAFLHVFRNLKKFEARASFYTWLYRIVVNTCRDAKRRERRRRWLIPFSRVGKEDEKQVVEVSQGQGDPAGQEPGPLESLSWRELRSRVQDSLAGLSEQQRMVFELKVFEERSIPEIARILGNAEGTVKSHLFRATQHVRKALGDWVDGEKDRG